MLKYTGYVMSLDDARKFAEKQGIDPGPFRPMHNAILTNKFNIWLRKEKRQNVSAVGMDVMKDRIPVFHILWITRMRRGPPEISVYDEVPGDVAVKEWLASEGFPDVKFTTWVGATVVPQYSIPEIIPAGPGETPLTY